MHTQVRFSGSETFLAKSWYATKFRRASRRPALLCNIEANLAGDWLRFDPGAWCADTALHLLHGLRYTLAGGC